MRIRPSNDVGRRPTIKPVRTITVPLGAEHLAAVEAFQRREGISNLTEAIRIALWRFLVAEGLASAERPPEAPKRKAPS
jgi:hypothetical protein